MIMNKGKRKYEQGGGRDIKVHKAGTSEAGS